MSQRRSHFNVPTGRPAHRCFTQFWSHEQWEFERDRSDNLCDHTAGNRFRTRNIGRGDAIYIVGTWKGALRLAGRLVVDRICSFDQAVAHFRNDDLWPGTDHLIANRRNATPLRFDLEVPSKVIQKLWLISNGERVRPTFVAPAALDPQTFRAVRELTPASAALFDKLLNSPTVERDPDAEIIAQPRSVEDPMCVVRSRRNQGPFRKALRQLYGERCMVTGCTIMELVEAAHVKPYNTGVDNSLSNGLLLRSDVHTLFDENLIGIDPRTLRVCVNTLARRDGYEAIHGVKLRTGTHRPDGRKLRVRWKHYLDRQRNTSQHQK